MKTVTLHIAGYESAAVEIVITPSDTALEILTRIGLRGLVGKKGANI